MRFEPTVRWGYCKACFKKFITHPMTPIKKQEFCSYECRYRYWNEQRKKQKKEWSKRQYSKYAEGKLQCRICGGWYNVPTNHATQAHGVTADWYKERFNIKKLASPIAHKNMQRNAQKKWRIDKQKG